MSTTFKRRTQQEIIDRLMIKPGLRSKIDAHCVSCVYDDLVPGSWRKQVELCSIPTCPIYDVRPRSSALRPHKKAKGVSPNQLGRSSLIPAKNVDMGTFQPLEIESESAA